MRDALRRAGLAGAQARIAYGAVVLLLGTLICLKLGFAPGHPNLAAALAFAVSAAGLVSLRSAFRSAADFRPAQGGPVFDRRALWAAGALATAWVLTALPATYRATQSVREVIVFWHDEGITLEQVFALVKTPGGVPDYRLLQGWLTFLPVALLCKGIDSFVPIDVGTLNLLMRHYHLAATWGVLFCSVLLGQLLTRSVLLGLLITLLAFWRPDIYILLAIDRPDGFQLLFMLLAMICLVRYVRGEDRMAVVGALFFAGLAFASKFSGHLLLPAIGLAWLWRRRHEHLATGAGRYAPRLAGDAAVFAIAAGVIFVLTFFLATPYHLLRFWDLVSQIVHFLPVYGAGNIYNVPDYRAEPSALLWWKTFIGRGRLDYWMLIACGAGLATCMVAALKALRAGRPLASESFLAVWFVTYAAFMVRAYGGDLVEYRYVFPILFFVPYFALYPFAFALDLRKAGGLLRAGVALMLCAALAVPTWRQMTRAFQYVAAFRQTSGPRFEIGRYLNRLAPLDRSSSVLMTNLAYIPERFADVTVANVTVTAGMLEKKKFDYVIMAPNMYEVYAGKPIDPNKNPYYAGYDVYYNDVVAAYTAFKQHAYPGYRFVKSFGGWELFERVP